MTAAYFCVDAGATRSRGRLYDSAGMALADAEAGPANFSYDPDQAIANLAALWAGLAAAVGRKGEDTAGVALSIGGAGLFQPAPRAAFEARMARFPTVHIMSDGYAALIGAGSGKPSALVTIGTGVAGHRLFADGSSIQRDGWGWIAGDRGGGVWLGTRALRHAIAVWDGVEPASALSTAVIETIGGRDGLLGGGISGLNAHKLAAFAPLVLDTANGGCAVARRILARGADHLAALVGALRCEDVPLYLNGGLARVLQPMLVERIGRPIDEAAGDALHGCLLAALGKAPPEHAVFDPA